MAEDARFNRDLKSALLSKKKSISRGCSRADFQYVVLFLTKQSQPLIFRIRKISITTDSSLSLHIFLDFRSLSKVLGYHGYKCPDEAAYSFSTTLGCEFNPCALLFVTLLTLRIRRHAGGTIIYNDFLLSILRGPQSTETYGQSLPNYENLTPSTSGICMGVDNIDSHSTAGSPSPMASKVSLIWTSFPDLPINDNDLSGTIASHFMQLILD